MLFNSAVPCHAMQCDVMRAQGALSVFPPSRCHMDGGTMRVQAMTPEQMAQVRLAQASLPACAGQCRCRPRGCPAPVPCPPLSRCMCPPARPICQQVHPLTPEQMAAYQQHFPFPVAFATPAAAAAAQAAAAAAAAAKTADGVPADASSAGSGAGAASGSALPAVPAVPAMPVAAVAYPLMDPQLLARQMAAAAQAQGAFPIPIPHAAAVQAAAAAAAANASHQGPNPRNDRHFWKEHEQQELLRLVADQQYRQTVLGEHPGRRGGGRGGAWVGWWGRLQEASPLDPAVGLLFEHACAHAHARPCPQASRS